MPCCKDDIIYIHPDSKFALELTFTSPSGEVINPGTHTFKYEYLDEDKRNAYPVSHNAETGEFVNCFIKDNRLYAKFEGFKFREGLLLKKVEVKEVIVPDEGEGLTDNTEVIYTICKTNFFISSQAGCCEPGCVAGYDNFVYPCVESGITQSQAQQEINEYICNKKLIADAITLKGVESSLEDTAKQLSEKILSIPNNTIKFATSGNLNPKWTDLQSKIAQNYNENKRKCWAFSFRSAINEINLIGGDYYICSDGYETSQSETHLFGPNLDNQKTDNWVIIYTENSVFVFPDSLKKHLIGAAFYNTTPENVLCTNTTISFISQIGSIEKEEMTIPAYFAQQSGISYFDIPEEIKHLIINDYAFDSCYSLLEFTVPNSLKSLIIRQYAFRNVRGELYFLSDNLDIIYLNALALAGYQSPDNLNIKSKSSIYIQQGGVSAVANTLYLESDLIQGEGSTFSGCRFTEIVIEARKVFNGTGADAFLNSTLLNKVTFYCPEEIIYFAGFYLRTSNQITTFELLPNRKTGLWDKSINLSQVANQTASSMYQNINALADRTGQTAQTITYGATKRNALLAAYPDAAQIASNKNWNIA